MANRNPNHSTRVKKGQVLNPEGGRSHNPITKAIKRLTNAQIAEIGASIVTANRDEFKAIAESPDASMLQQWFAKVVLNGVARGDHKALDVVLNRIAGKVQDRVLHGSDPAAPIALAPQIILMLPDNGKAVKGSGNGSDK